MGHLYMHPRTKILQVTKLPNNSKVLGGIVHEDDSNNDIKNNNSNRGINRNLTISYYDRGWPCMENCWASLVKDKIVVDLCMGDHNVDDVEDGTRQLPLLPEAFDIKVGTLPFANLNDDRPKLKQLYRRSLEETFNCATCLNLSGRNWNSTHTKNLLDLFENGYAPTIPVLYLGCNNLDEAFAK